MNTRRKTDKPAATALVVGSLIVSGLASGIVLLAYLRTTAPHNYPAGMIAYAYGDVAIFMSLSGAVVLGGLGFLFMRLYQRQTKLLAWMENAADTDELTQLFNRRRLQADIKHWCKRQASAKVAILMLDIDHFKQINDNYGHITGDHVLQQLADALQNDERVSSNDIIYRYGGEEFCLVRDRTDDVVEFAEYIRQMVAKIDFDQNIRVTVSIGIAITTMQDVAKGILHADRALYQAKAQKRNCCVFNEGGSAND